MGVFKLTAGLCEEIINVNRETKGISFDVIFSYIVRFTSTFGLGPIVE